MTEVLDRALLERQPAISERRVTQAVIIAAGRGSRLKGVTDLPKPLVRLGGLTLLERTLLTLKKAGIRNFVIVLGYRAREIRASLDLQKLGVLVRCVENPLWERQNGLSVLAAEPYVQGPFLLTMSDHLLSPDIARKLIESPLEPGEAALAVDKNVEGVADLDDATKVLEDRGLVAAIGKDLKNFNAIDTGVFLGTSGLFEALHDSQESGDCSLSDGVRRLAKAGRMRTVNTTGAFWLDVDTPEALALGRKVLFERLTKPQDGFLASRLNRPLSLSLTRRLADTTITPNQVTLMLLALGLFAATFFAQGTYVSMLIGAILFQAQSIFDGTDGELARLKFQESPFGGVLDVVCDCLVTAAGFYGMGVGVAIQTGDPVYQLLGALGALGTLGCTGFLFLLVRRRGRFSGAYKTLSPFSPKNQKPPTFFRTLNRALDGLSRRDYTYLVLGLVLFGRLSWFVWASGLGVLVYLAAMAVLYTASFFYEKN